MTPLTPADHLGAVRRGLTDGERDGVPVRVLTAERTYDAAPADVWDALTSAERLPRWFMPVSGDLEVGGRYQLEGNAGGEVLACDPPRRLEVTWEHGGVTSWVEVRLTPTDGTTLRLTHSAPVEQEFWDRYGPGATGVGWELSLMGLALHLQPGSPERPAEADPAWALSAEGIAFATGSGRAWGDTAIAAGEEPEAARAAAGRTIAFYTGVPEA